MRRARTVDEQPHHITFDRMLIHSTSNTNRLRHGIMLNGHYMAVINSHIANVKDTADAQAIWTIDGDGPYKIVNNFLEATGENFMSGGTDPIIAGDMPSDIEFRGNHVFKRLDWKTNDLWGVKNLFELKNARRLLITGNIFENNWVDAQTGSAIVIKSVNQNNSADGAPWSVSEDIVFSNNIIRHASEGFRLSGRSGESSPGGQTARVKVENNLFYDISSVNWGGSGDCD